MRSQLIFLGAPGAGKGTQASRLAQALDYQHVSTGELLRREVRSGSDLGERVKTIVHAGHLVDDDTMVELLKAHCNTASSVYIFDGFPRNKDQAALFDQVILQSTKSRAIYFEVDLGLLAERLLNRRICGQCGQVYGLITNPPQDEEICDSCGAKALRQRRDDNEKALKTRLEVFKSAIGPILDYYEDSGRLLRVDASLDPESVFKHLCDIVAED